MISLTANEGRALLMLIIRATVLAEGCRNPANASGSPGETSASIYFGPGNDITAESENKTVTSPKAILELAWFKYKQLPDKHVG